MRNLVAETIETAKRKGIDLCNKKKICISLDVNGPLTATNSASLEPYPGIKEAIKELDKMGVYIIINSAWDICTSKVFNEKKLDGVADAIIGENGSVYCFRDTKPVITIGTDTREQVLDLFIKTLDVCSKIGYSFAAQGNLVNACYYYEFEKGLAENICRQGTSRPTTIEFYDTLKKNGIEARIIDNGVEIDYSRDKCKQLQRILSNEYKLVTIRPFIRNGKILIQLDKYRDRIISLSDLNELAKKVICDLNEWNNYRVNNDFCIDYFLSKNFLKNDVTKATALNQLQIDLCDRLKIENDNLLILGIGDGENDSCIGNIKNALFFGISGTKSEGKCDMKVSDGLEFLNIVKNIGETINKRGRLVI
jgi:hydroxymethylpyrimidine pyrophosphatase-like HAD family hydrolase